MITKGYSGLTHVPTDEPGPSIFNLAQRVFPTRRHAELVLLEISALSKWLEHGFDAAHNRPCSKKIAHHRFFLDLYGITTFYWIERSAHVEYPTFIYQIIVNFFEYYRKYVYESIAFGDQRYPIHWSQYFLKADDFRRSKNLYDGALMVYQAAYAHTRFDLVEAIVDAYQACRNGQVSVPNLGVLKQDLLNSETNRVFASAALDFAGKYQNTSRNFLPTYAFKLIKIGSGCVQRLWLPYFQRWRRQAWQEAIECLMENRQPYRPYHSRVLC